MSSATHSASTAPSRPLDRPLAVQDRDQRDKLVVMELILNLDIGGAQEAVRTLVQYMASDRCTPLVCTFQDGPMRKEIEQLGKAQYSADLPIPDFFVKDVQRTDPAVRGDLARSIQALEFRDETIAIHGLPCPLAILHGEQDRLVNQNYIRELNIPNLWRGKIHIIPQAAHVPQWEQPEAFNQLLLDYMIEAAQ